MNQFKDTKFTRAKAKIIEKTYITVVRLLNSRGKKYFAEEKKLSLEEILALYPLDVNAHVSTIESPEIIWGLKRNKGHFQEQLFSLASTFVPMKPFENSYQSFVENHLIHGVNVRYRDNNKEPIALLYGHGWSERDYILIRRLLSYVLARNPALDIFAMQLPYHMKRKPKQASFSGSFFLDGVPLRNLEASRQSVHDFSQMLSALKKQYKKVIVAGTSLGGHLISFVATQDPRADGYVMGLTGADITLYLPKLPLAPSFHTSVAKMGITYDQMMCYYEPWKLKQFTPAVAGSKIAICAGKYDLLIPYASAQELTKFFDAKYVEFFPGGHFSFSLYAQSFSRQIGNIIKDLSP